MPKNSPAPPQQRNAQPPRTAGKLPSARKTTPALPRKGAPASKGVPVKKATSARKAAPSRVTRSPSVGLRPAPRSVIAKSARPARPPRQPRPPRPPRPPRFRLPAARPANPDRRVRIALVAALAVFGVFAGRLFQLQSVDASALAAKALASRSKTFVLPAHRGDILDTNGASLATSFDRIDVTLDQRLIPQYNLKKQVPDQQKGVAGAARALAPILGLSVATVTTRLTGGKAFAYLDKSLEPALWRDISGLAIPGVYRQTTSRRNYPGDQVAASVVGFVGADGNALSGIELKQNSLLSGTAGKLSYETGKGGQQIATGLRSEVDPVPGRDVQLTIDADLEYRAQQALTAAVKATGSKAGTAVILDTRTSDILALADAPTFNANQPGSAPAADRENRSLTDVFEPGSTEKVITAAAALQEGKAKPTTRLVVPGTLVRGGKLFHDAENHGTEKLTLAGVLAKSSNIGAIKIGERLSAATMYSYMSKFGLGARTGIGLAESPGILAPYQNWNNSQRYTVLFGQGLSVTSLQMAEVFATIANDGVRRAPRLIKAIGDTEGKLQPQSLGQPTQVLSAQVARQMRQMLEGVVSDNGTAVRATIPGYRVAGKTGTAQYYDPKVGRYNGFTASFIGIAPADKPRLVVAVFLQRPVGDHYGGDVAAPVFQQLMSYALVREGVAPTGTKAPEVPLDWR